MSEGIFWVGSRGWMFFMGEWWLVLVGRGIFWEGGGKVLIFMSWCLSR